MTSYWSGPYNVQVPIECKLVPEPDGNCNRDISVTEVYSARKPMSEQACKDRYCELRNDGYWYVARSPPFGFKGWVLDADCSASFY